MASRSIKSIFERSKPYILLALINAAFFLIPLACNFYVDDVKIEDVSRSIANIASSLGGEQNTLAITLRSPKESRQDTGNNHFGIDVSNYNGLFLNSLQLTDGIVSDDLDFSYNGVSLSEINYVMTSSIFSNHQGVRGLLFDKYQIYLFSKNSNSGNKGYDNFCYITERTAKKMMASDANLKSYDDIINKTLTVQYGDIVHTWNIGNIILDKEEFYSQMSFIYGDFILAYTHSPGDLGRNVCLSAYFGSNTYLNMDKLSTLFSFDNPTYEIYRGNLDERDTETLDAVESFLNDFSYNKPLTVLYYIEIGVSIALNAYVSWVYLKRQQDRRLVPLLISGAAALIMAYVPFWIIYKATSNIHFLSRMGVFGLLIAFACAEIVFLAFELYQRRKTKR